MKTSKEAKFQALLEEFLSVIDEEVDGEPCIGRDHTGHVNWSFDFADKVRAALVDE